MRIVDNIHKLQVIRMRKGAIYKPATAYTYCELGGGMDQAHDPKM